ncbi:kinase-like domain-containing protein [Limtongia smithiae]|uniref:kinase-like domain-containing protein n=1 Tax=Limtongia smithiae TaxID=1125753 RepID=UPI0034CECF4B
MTLAPNSAGGGAGENDGSFERRPQLCSQLALDQADTARVLLENYYNSSVASAVERNKRRTAFESRLAADKGSEERRQREQINFGRREAAFLRLRRTKIGPGDFNTLAMIGIGAFGEVRLVQKTDTAKIYAMKKMLKSRMRSEGHLAHVRAERDILAGSDSPWVVGLHYSFQDPMYLYLIMDYLPGGDFMNMLIANDTFAENVTKFYMAECVLAIENIHALGFIHRDIKPDNILIDRDGHLKFTDFGLSTGFHRTHDSNYYKHLLEHTPASDRPLQNTVNTIHLTMSNRAQFQSWRKSRRLLAYSKVGTPDYLAPEVFTQNGYSHECDWWSLGAIMYECLVGYAPFASDNEIETYQKIMRWQEYLTFPEEICLSPEAEDLIRSLLTVDTERLGRGGASEIKAHPFFADVDWDMLRHMQAPFVPRLESVTDTSYFPTEDFKPVRIDDEDTTTMDGSGSNSPVTPYRQQAMDVLSKDNLPFIGYTYARFNFLEVSNFNSSRRVSTPY